MSQENNVKRGLFVTFEGTEGAGKSTLLHSAADYLAKQGVELLTLREPGGTEVGEEIRGMLKNAECREPILPETELLLMYASRVQLVQARIKPALAQGQVVLCDRHDLSSFAYQGGGRGIAYERIAALREAVLGDFRPDLTLLLDVPAELGMERVQARGRKDRFEQERIDFFRRVRQAYLDAAAHLPFVKVIDGTQSMEAVRAQALAAIQALLKP